MDILNSQFVAGAVPIFCKCTVLAVLLAVLPAWGEVDAQTPTPLPAEKRLLPLDNTLNTRDLGGYRAVDGRTVKWGLLYRSDSLAKLEGQDLQYLAELGLSVITDFRSAHERAEAPDRLPEQALPISYQVVSVNDPAVDIAELGRKVFSG